MPRGRPGANALRGHETATDFKITAMIQGESHDFASCVCYQMRLDLEGPLADGVVRPCMVLCINGFAVIWRRLYSHGDYESVTANTAQGRAILEAIVADSGRARSSKEMGSFLPEARAALCATSNVRLQAARDPVEVHARMYATKIDAYAKSGVFNGIEARRHLPRVCATFLGVPVLWDVCFRPRLTHNRGMRLVINHLAGCSTAAQVMAVLRAEQVALTLRTPFFLDPYNLHRPGRRGAAAALVDCSAPLHGIEEPSADEQPDEEAAPIDSGAPPHEIEEPSADEQLAEQAAPVDVPAEHTAVSSEAAEGEAPCPSAWSGLWDLWLRGTLADDNGDDGWAHEMLTLLGTMYVGGGDIRAPCDAGAHGSIRDAIAYVNMRRTRLPVAIPVRLRLQVVIAILRNGRADADRPLLEDVLCVSTTPSDFARAYARRVVAALTRTTT